MSDKAKTILKELAVVIVIALLAIVLAEVRHHG